ncbi:MAG: Lpg1974 family pore-forming outer membrane protein [Planctomycetaceae bacterium]
MKPIIRTLSSILLIVLATSVGKVWAQALPGEGADFADPSQPKAPGVVSLPNFEPPPALAERREPASPNFDPDDVFAQNDAGFVAGADYLLIRPHFSEALAFVEGRQTPATFSSEGRELHWDYESAFRVFAGYRFGGDRELRFTYWRVTSDTGEQGRISQPGQFIVDPFGNVAGALVVIDPTNALFGQVIVGGDSISTRARVELNLYDVDFIQTTSKYRSSWSYGWSAGVRIADVDQFYASTITSNGAFFAGGDYSSDFIGAGPRLGLNVKRSFGTDRNFALFAETHAALIVGDYDVRSSMTATVPAPFRVEQGESLTRTIPVVEGEFGASWRMNDSLSISGGWMFQAWHDLGGSGGKFGGLFGGADDANIMSFDGLFLRGEIAY